ncbi:methyltransferase [Nocardia sp. BMG51109]|uniref:methyltransferase n=1 Tax=Nocardia sp. BMG51109 TaxID=1056816 RepID=UPI0004676F44|nr:methyltransferase [Nocardia sp. BMG51109]
MLDTYDLSTAIRKALTDGGTDDLEREAEFALAMADLEPIDTQLTIVDRLRQGESPYHVFGCYPVPDRDTVVDIWPNVMPPGCATAPMIQAIREVTATRGQVIADLGSGSGVLGIAALLECETRSGLFLDVDALSCACARDNVARLGLDRRADVVQADVRAAADHLDGVEVVVANLPYVPSVDVATLPKRFTAYASTTAVDGGHGGLDLITDTITRLQHSASSCTAMVLQLGAGQASAVLQHLEPGWHTSVRHCGPASIVLIER